MTFQEFLPTIPMWMYVVMTGAVVVAGLCVAVHQNLKQQIGIYQTIISYRDDHIEMLYKMIGEHKSLIKTYKELYHLEREYIDLLQGPLFEEIY